MSYTVYMHKNKLNGKVYVGVTNDINRRWRFGGCEYKPSTFWDAIQKFGWNNFEHIILESGLTEKEGEEKEKYYISLYDSRNPDKGYNVAEGGRAGHLYLEHPKGMKGKHHSEEKKRAQSELMKKLNVEGKCGAVWKNGHPKGMLGKHHSEAFKQRLREIPPDQHPSARKVEILYSDGRKEQYGCLRYVSEKLGIAESTLIKTIKSGEPYALSPKCYKNRENLAKIDGAKIYYLENTEITG